MKYSISNWIYGSEQLPVTFERLKKYGYDGIELEGEPAKYQANTVRDLCQSFGLEVLSIAGMYPLAVQDRDLSHPNKAIRKHAVEYLDRICDFASEVAAPLVIVVPSLVGRVTPVGNHTDEERWVKAAEDQWKYAVESVSMAACYAEKIGVILALEPINRYETFLLNTAEQAIEFAAATDSAMVRIHLDTFHMNIEEASPPHAIRQVGDLLANVHIADNNRQSVGRGQIDFPAIIQALVGIEYSGALAMEPLPPVPDPYIAARLSRYRHLHDIYAEECIDRLRKLEEEALQSKIAKEDD